MYGHAHTTSPQTTTQATTESSSDELVEQPWGNLATADYLFGEGDRDEAIEKTTPTGEGDGYRNQLDNESLGGVEGSSQCLLTSTTMMLLDMLGDTFLDVACVQTALVGLPSQRAVLEGKEPEQIVFEWIRARDWSDCRGVDGWEDVFQTTTFIEVCVEEWTGTALDADWDQARSCRERLEGLVALPTVISTNLTSSGHVVTLLSVDGGGVVVHDPNGAFGTTGYLRNGCAPGSERPPAHRWEACPYLAEAFDAGEARDDWGRENRFTWDEVEAWDIGKWAVDVEGSFD